MIHYYHQLSCTLPKYFEKTKQTRAITIDYEKLSRPLIDNAVNTHAKEFNQKAQFHLHRHTEGTMKC